MPSATTSNDATGQRLNFLGLLTGVVGLALSIANNTQSVIQLVDFSGDIVRNWAWVTNGIRQWVWETLSNAFDINLHWVTARLVPTLLVLAAIAVFGLRRRRAGAAPFGLGLAQRTPALSMAIALFLILAMVVLEQSYFSLGEDGKTPRPAGMTDAQQQEMVSHIMECRQQSGLPDRFDAVCAITPGSPMLQAYKEFGLLDVIILVAYLGLLTLVVLYFQAEVMWAFLLAFLFAGLGHVALAIR